MNISDNEVVASYEPRGSCSCHFRNHVRDLSKLPFKRKDQITEKEKTWNFYVSANLHNEISKKFEYSNNKCCDQTQHFQELLKMLFVSYKVP